VIRYTDDLDGLTPDRLTGFFEGWWTKPSAETHLRTLRRSETAVIALEAESDRVIGFVTAIGDGTLAAYIPFLEVLPEYRGQGIGTELMRRIIERLRGRYMIDLACDEELLPFYERLGMIPGRAMTLRDRSGLAATKEE
jgi:ribosomal protein S18 acetylase RimI-like enzyme